MRRYLGEKTVVFSMPAGGSGQVRIIKRKAEETMAGRDNFSGGWDIRVIRSGRKSVALQIDKDLLLTVRAPYRMSDREIREFIEEK